MKRFLSLLLVFSMVISMVPAAFAEESGILASGSVDLEDGLAYESVTVTAPSDGVITVAISNADPGYEIGVGNESYTGGASGSHEFSVSNGTEVEVIFYGYNPEAEGDDVYCGATYDYEISFVADVFQPATYTLEDGVTQSIAIPVNGYAYVVVDATNSDMTLNVNGNRNYYDWYILYNDMQCTPYASGAREVELTQGDEYTIAIYNTSTDTDQVVDVTASSPVVGTVDNPDTLVLGTNTADVAYASQGYFWNWTAPSDGKLTVSVSADTGWTYSVNNTTTSVYGDTHFSDDEVVVNSETIAVSEGDVIQVVMNTYDANNMWASPAGTLTVEASFVEGALGSLTNPYVYSSIEALVYAWTEKTVEAGATVYIQAPLGGETLTITSDTTAAAIVTSMGAGLAYHGESYTFGEEAGLSDGDVVIIGIRNQNPSGAAVVTLTAGSDEGEEDVEVVSDTTLYLNVGDQWPSDSAWFAVYYWDADGSNGWAAMTNVEGTIYTGVVPAGYTNVIFTRMNPEYTECSWTAKWNQTNDLTIPADGSNCFEINDPWNTTDTGDWTTYTPAVEEPTIEATALTIGNNGINMENCAWSYTAPSAGTLTLTASAAIMGDVSISYTVNGGEAVALELSSTVELTLAEGDVVVITVIAEGYATLTAAWAGEGDEEETGDTLVLGDNENLTLSDDPYSPYTWTYTAAEAGTVTVTVSALDQVPEAYLDTVFGRGTYVLYVNDTNNSTNSVSVTVAAGDTVTVQIANWYGATTVATVNVAFEASSGEETEDPNAHLTGSGTTDDPYLIESLPAVLEFTLNDNNSKDIYFSYTAEKAGTIEYADATCDVLWIQNGDYVNGSSVEVTEGETILINTYTYGDAGVYTLSLAYVEETAEATVLLDETATTADAEEAFAGVYFNTTAPSDGYVTINFTIGSIVPEFRVVIAEDYENAEWFNYLVDNTCNGMSFDVCEGDAIEVGIATLNAETGEYEAGSISFTLTFTAVASEGGDGEEGGDEVETTDTALDLGSNVIEVAVAEANSADYTFTAPADGTLNISITDLICVSYAGEESWTDDMADAFDAEQGGLALYVNGESLGGLTGSITVSKGDKVSFVLYSARLYQATGYGWNVTVELSMGTGTSDDPQIITAMGDYSVDVTGGWTTHYMNYTAPASGTLTFTMNTASDWVYYVTNLANYSGTGYNYDDYGSATGSVQVSAGETLEIYVNTQSGESATLSFTLSFEEHEVAQTVNLYSYDIPCYTVDIAAGKTVNYVIYYMGGNYLTVTGEGAYVIMDGVTYEAVNGVVTVYISSYAAELVIGNSGTETAAFYLDVYVPVGSYNNPEEIVGTGTFTGTVAGGEYGEGYYFIWTPEDPTAEGLVTVTVNNTTAWQFSVSNYGTSYYGDTHYSDDNPVVKSETMAFFAGNSLEIYVNTWDASYTYPAGAVSITISFEECEIPEGSQYNPYLISYYGTLPANVSVAAGAEVYAKVTYFSGYALTVTGEGAYVVMNGVTYEAVDGVVTVPVSDYSVTVIIGNSSTEDAVYVADILIPLGHSNNPEVITEDGTYTTSAFTDGSYDNYYYQYTAAEDGTISVEVLNDSYWRIYLWNKTTYASSNANYNSAESNIVTLKVNAGDLVQIYGSTYSYATYSNVAGSLSFKFSFEKAEEDTSDGTALIDGDNTIETENLDGTQPVYKYTYVATQSGTLYLTMSNVNYYTTYTNSSTGVTTFYGPYEGRNQITNYTTLKVNGSALAGGYYDAIEVTEGDEITITWAIRYASYKWTFEGNLNLSYEGYNPAPGSEADPITLSYSNCPANTIKIAAGSTAYYTLQYFSGKYITVTGEGAYIIYNDVTYTDEDGDGVVTLLGDASTMSVQIGNSGDTDAIFVINYYYPAGTSQNPEDLTEGKISHYFEADGDPYYYDFTAPCDGTVTFTVSGDSWCFMQYNKTTYVYGEYQNSSTYEDRTYTESVEVFAGDVIVITLSAEWEYEDDLYGSAPETTVTLVTEFDALHEEADAVIENEIEATCTVDGSYDTVVYCEICGEEISRETTVIKADGVTHSFTEYVSNDDATCTEDGTKTAVCDYGCGETDTVADTDSAFGHVMMEMVQENIVEPTCTEDGCCDLVGYCEICGVELSRIEGFVLEAIGHEFEDNACIHCGELAIVITAQPEDVTTAVGQTVTFTVTAEGNGLTYKWQYLKDDGTWGTTTLAGYKTETLTVKATAARNGKQYRCVITDADGNTVTSEPATLTVKSLEITAQPESVTAAAGDVVTFTVVAEGDELSYKWQYLKDDGTWGTTTLTGYKTATLTVTATAARNGKQYRCVVTDAYGNTVTSEAATLTVKTVLAITTQPTVQKVAVGTSAVFTVVAEGDGLTYQWQYRTSSTASWKNATATGNKTATMTVPGTTGRSGYGYRCVITDAYGNTVTSNSANLYVLGVTSQPVDQYVVKGATATFSVTATGSYKSYQWQYSTDGVTWKNATATGNKTAKLSVPGTTGRNGYLYRCQITDAAGNVVYSNAAALYVLGITGQPSSVSISAGSTAKFTVTAVGNGLSYQWQYSTDGTSWSNTSLSGNKTATLSVKATAGRNGYQYRCVITDAAGNTVTTDVVTLTVK